MWQEFKLVNWKIVFSLLGCVEIPSSVGKRDTQEFMVELPERVELDRPIPRKLLVVDNGGEINLLWVNGTRSTNGNRDLGEFYRYGDRILEPAYDGSVAYYHWGEPVDPLVMASRISDAIEGREVDYLFGVSEAPHGKNAH